MRLYAWLEDEWAKMDVAPTTWCREHNIADATVLRWKQGVEPDLRNLIRIADELGRSLLDVLLAGEYVDAEQVGNHEVSERSYDARTGIRLDRSLSEVAKTTLLGVLDGIEAVQSGSTDRVHVQTGRRPRARKVT